MFAYYVLMWGWTSFAGSSEFMLRLPSVVFDTATVPLIYLLGVELGNRRAGLVAALLLTINATSIEYAQTARSYSMLVMLTTLASVFFIRALKTGSKRSLAGYVASASLDIYAHLFAILTVPAQWLALFLFVPSGKRGRA